MCVGVYDACMCIYYGLYNDMCASATFVLMCEPHMLCLCQYASDESICACEFCFNMYQGVCL